MPWQVPGSTYVRRPPSPRHQWVGQGIRRKRRYSRGAIIIPTVVVGDNLDYWLIGRLGGRALFRRWPRLRRYAYRVQVLPTAVI
jgi:hypothetical protein